LMPGSPPTVIVMGTLIIFLRKMIGNEVKYD